MSAAPAAPVSPTTTTTTTAAAPAVKPRRSSTPPTVTVRRAGWSGRRGDAADILRAGLLTKEVRDVPRDDSGVAAIDGIISTAITASGVFAPPPATDGGSSAAAAASDAATPAGAVAVFVKRKGFPIMQVSTTSSDMGDGVLQEQQASLSLATSESSVSLAACGMSASVSLAEMQRDVVSVIVVDEATPQIPRREAEAGAENALYADYDLPPGARVEGNRVFVTQKNPFAGDDEEPNEVNVPLDFFRRRDKSSLFGGEPIPFGGGGGGTLFGLNQQQQQQPRFGTTKQTASLFSSLQQPSSSLFGASAAAAPTTAKPAKESKPAKPPTNPFGAQPTFTFASNASPPTFGAGASSFSFTPQPGGLFGGGTSSSLFGSNNNTNNGGSLFGTSDRPSFSFNTSNAAPPPLRFGTLPGGGAGAPPPPSAFGGSLFGPR